MKLYNTISKIVLSGVLAIGASVSTFAATSSEKSSLTLEQAVNRAISSCDIKTVYGSYLDAYEEITKYNRDVFDKNYRTTKLNEMQYKFNMKHINDKIAYDTTDTYLSIIELYKKMDVLNSKIDIAEKMLDQVTIKKDKGMASELEYKAAENDVTNLKAQMVTLEKNLANEVIDFKNLTNMDITKYELDTDFKLEDVKIEGDVSYYFDKKLEDFYGLTQEKINIGQLGTDDMFGMDWGSYLLQEAGITEDKYTLDNLKETMSTNLMGYYNNLDVIKASIETYDVNIASSKNTLKAQEIKYNNGYISKLAYEQSLLEQQNLECEKFAQVKNYITTKMIVEEPNILAMK